MKPNIGIDSANLKNSSKVLSKILADLMVIYVKTLNYHWNVRGHHFGALHAFFKGHYEKYAEMIDEVAERIRTLGEDAPGSMKAFLQEASLKEHEGGVPKEKEMLEHLLNDQEHMICSLRKEVDETAESCHDMGTSDFLTQLLSTFEQTAWMTRAHLES